MKTYDSFKYIYPPRPATKAPPSGLKTYERMGFIAQPKLNGSCGVLFLDGKSARLMGRHNNAFAREILRKDDLQRLHRGAGYMVITGEYMNKSQKDGKGKPFNGFVIFDILVHNGKHLLGSTFMERQALLETLFPSGNSFDDYIDEVGPSAYRVRNITSNLTDAWNRIIKTEMYEGFVLKRPDGILENGFREANNVGWQLKIRKPTKNYKY
jgi:ATP-dependent DNA ligase